MPIIGATITEDTIALISRVCKKNPKLALFEKTTGLSLADNSILLRAALTYFLSNPPTDDKQIILIKGACQRPGSFCSFLENLLEEEKE